MTPADPPRIQTAYLSDVGRTRTENQDACAELQNSEGDQLLLVADGMGGHRGGATASQLLVETARELFERTPHPDSELLREAISEANARIYRAAEESPELEGMGTTAVAVLFGRDGRGWVAHVGDSRAYRLRVGGLARLTEDHSAVAELVRRGAISAEEAERHPRRNEILRAVGIAESVEVELTPLELTRDDRLLLCSDGLTGVLSDPEIAAVLQHARPVDAVRELVDAANARGGPDNVTVIVGILSSGARAARAPTSKRRRVLAIAAAALGVLAAIAVLLLLEAGRNESFEGGGLATHAAATDVAAPPPVEARSEGPDSTAEDRKQEPDP